MFPLTLNQKVFIIVLGIEVIFHINVHIFSPVPVLTFLKYQKIINITAKKNQAKSTANSNKKEKKVPVKKSGKKIPPALR